MKPAPIRYGVIGTGMMGCEHLRNLAAIDPSIAVATAISDPVEQSLAWGRTAAGHDIAEYEDHRALLASGRCDAVVIASPNFTHLSVLEDVLAGDLHVMVEKPMCTTVEDCRRVASLAAGRTALTWVGLEYRYMPPVARLIDEVRGGTVGRLRMLYIREHRFPFLVKVGNWNRFSRHTGGTLVEKCCHFFDLMNLVIGRRPVRVMASGAQDVNHLDERYPEGRPDILDNAYVIVDYEGGVRACLDLCMFAEVGGDEQQLTAVGDGGKVEAFIPSGRLVIGDRSTMTSTEVDVITDERVAHTGYHHGASYLEHLAFIDAIRTGGAAAVTVHDGLASVALGVAAHRSIDEARVVTMAEFGI